MAVWKNETTKLWAAKFQYQLHQYKKENFKTQEEALKWLILRRQELKNPPAPEPTCLTFSQLWTMYLEDCKDRFQKNTWRQKAFVYRNFQSFIKGDPPIDSIEQQKFVEYLKYRKNKSGNCAANRDLKEFKALCNWGIKRDLLKKNPCANIEKYPEEKKDRYVPPAEDINKVLQVAESDDKDLILTLYFTAGRISEIFNMTWKDVNFKDKWVRLWTRKRKGSELEEDKLRMEKTLYNVLKRRRENRDINTPYVFHNTDGSQYTKNQKKDTMKKLCCKAGVKVFGFHAIRHYVASILLESGDVGLAEVSKMLRHKKVSTTDNYIKALDPRLKRTAKTLEELLNGRKKL
jgi:integrase